MIIDYEYKLFSNNEFYKNGELYFEESEVILKIIKKINH